MLAKRIIPALDIKDGRVCKGVNFLNTVDAGEPEELAQRYSEEGADEIVLLDINASFESRGILLDVVKRVAKKLMIPLTVGGGIKSVEDFRMLLNAGADKVFINSAALKNNNLIREAAEIFGSQCVVVAIDAKRIPGVKRWEVYLNGGRIKTDKDAVEWAKEAEKLGAGEILLTSMDADGTKNGYDVELTNQISTSVKIPVIASGGAGKLEDFYEVIINGRADAVLAASLFHYREIEIKELKEYLNQKEITVRI